LVSDIYSLYSRADTLCLTLLTGLLLMLTALALMQRSTRG
jgi:hypothetical protein